jgi:hypothetical protein
MSFAMRYQAIPAGSGLIDRARVDADLGGSLCMIPIWLDGPGSPHPKWAVGDPLGREVAELVRLHPGLERRNYDLGTSWDVLHYLLSAHRRGRVRALNRDGFDATAPTGRRDGRGFSRDDWVDVAIRGGAPVGEHVTATQGVPVRYLSPSEVEGVAETFGSLTDQDLWAHYSVPDMEAAHVYKYPRAGEDWRKAFLSRALAELGQFYREVAGRGEHVIVCLD